jgi:hypothetical protein
MSSSRLTTALIAAGSAVLGAVGVATFAAANNTVTTAEVCVGPDGQVRVADQCRPSEERLIIQGEQGPKGDQGEPGPQGEQGLPGPAGQDGADGADGVDNVRFRPFRTQEVDLSDFDDPLNRKVIFPNVTIPADRVVQLVQTNAGGDLFACLPTGEGWRDSAIIFERGPGGMAIWFVPSDLTRTVSIECYSIGATPDNQSSIGLHLTEITNR